MMMTEVEFKWGGAWKMKQGCLCLNMSKGIAQSDPLERKIDDRAERRAIADPGIASRHCFASSSQRNQLYAQRLC